MNKKELVEAIVADVDVSKDVANRVVTSFLSHVGGAVCRGESVTLVNFGTFLVKDRAARRGTHPGSKKSIVIQGRRVVKFAAGKGLSDSLDGAEAPSA